MKNIQNIIRGLTKEELISFLRRQSSELHNVDAHSCYLVDLESGIPYMTSVYGSGLKVINGEGFKPSEDIHLKAQAIIAHTQQNHQTYTNQELLFAYAYDALYYRNLPVVA